MLSVLILNIITVDLRYNMDYFKVSISMYSALYVAGARYVGYLVQVQ